MHLFNTAILFVVLTLLGVEFSVSAFVNPTVWRLEPESQWKALSRFAVVGGKVMPVWYLVSTLLLGIQTWLCWHTPARSILLTVDAILVLIAVASIFVLVPLNNRVAEGAADWQRIHRIWDRIHRVRIAALAAAALLLTYVVAR
jgi:glucose uptake protein GlcU